MPLGNMDGGQVALRLKEQKIFVHSFSIMRCSGAERRIALVVAGKLPESVRIGYDLFCICVHGRLQYAY